MMQCTELVVGGCEFFNLHALEEVLQRNVVRRDSRGRAEGNRIAAIFTEFPSNPLLHCPDLVK